MRWMVYREGIPGDTPVCRLDKLDVDWRLSSSVKYKLPLALFHVNQATRKAVTAIIARKNNVKLFLRRPEQVI